MTDDDIAERIVKLIRRKTHILDKAWLSIDVTHFLDDAEAYHLAFIDGVRERAAVRRQARRVRRLVFAGLGVGDGAAAGK